MAEGWRTRREVLGRVQLFLLCRVDGWVRGVRAQQFPRSDNILVCPVLVPFEICRKGSRVGVGEDIMQLRQNVSGIGLERLLRKCPFCHSEQQSVLLGNGGGGKGGKEPPISIECKRSLAEGGESAKASPERHDVTRKVRDCGKLFPQRQTQRVYLCTRHRPVESSHRNDDVSRGEMKGACVGIRNSKTIAIAYAIKDRSTEGC